MALVSLASQESNRYLDRHRSAQDEPHSSKGEHESMYDYQLYGQRVRSDFRLPLECESDSEASVPSAANAAWTFRRVDDSCEPAPDAALVDSIRCYASCHNGAEVLRIYTGSDGTVWVWHEAAGVFRIHPNRCPIAVDHTGNCDERLLALTLIGPISVHLLSNLGYPCLHASAVVIDKGGVIFLGNHGGGKSTMAAMCLRRGAALLTDDILTLEARNGEVLGRPGPPWMKLWDTTAKGALDISHELPRLMQGLDKRLLRLGRDFALASDAIPLRAIYVLDRYEPTEVFPPICSLTQPNGADQLLALLAHTAHRGLVQSKQNASQLALYSRLARQARVQILRYPSGFGFQDDVYAHIMRDLGNQ